MRKRTLARAASPHSIDKKDLQFPLEHGLIIVQTRQSDGNAYGNAS